MQTYEFALKYVYADGTVKYSDINSHYCVDISNKSTYHSGLVQKNYR